MGWGQDWAPYVSVAQKLRKAVKRAEQVAAKQKRRREPVILQGRQIAKTFWGQAWCDNLVSYQDFSNRLPRGATYVRNGSVVDLVIKPKLIEAIVAGSVPYAIRIQISELEAKRWKAIRSECSESIESLLDLLSGKLSDGVMRRLTEPKAGLFPAPAEIRMTCSCPDYSSCCKHLAAVMYGVGARLDRQPELLFLLRGVDHQELVSQAIAAGNLDRELDGTGSSLDSQDLSAIFGIELDSSSKSVSGKGGGIKRSTARKPIRKKTAPAPAPAPMPESIPAVKTTKSSGNARAAVKVTRPRAAAAKAPASKPGNAKVSAKRPAIDIAKSVSKSVSKPVKKPEPAHIEKSAKSGKSASKSLGKTIAKQKSR